MATINGFRCNLLRDRFGDDVLRTIFQNLFVEYAISFEACDGDFDEVSELRTVVPFHRRGRIEQSLRSIATVHEHIQAQTVEDDSGFWSHVQLIAQDVILTQASCNEKEMPYNEPRYRKDLSQPQFRQMLLITQDQLEDACGDTLTVYGLLLHRGTQEIPGILGAAIIRFPTETSNEYFEDQFDLFQEYPEIVEQFQETPIESNEIDQPVLPDSSNEMENEG